METSRLGVASLMFVSTVGGASPKICAKQAKLLAMKFKPDLGVLR
jgi:hypothetical protein